MKAPADNAGVGERPKTTRHRLIKIPNLPCLYRHENGSYYAIKKHLGKIRTQALKSEAGRAITDQKLAERKLREWLDDLDSAMAPSGKLILDTCSDILSENDKKFEEAELAKLA